MSAEWPVRYDEVSSAHHGAPSGLDGWSLLAAIGVGAAAMYLMDPQRGRRRRRVLADRFIHAGHRANAGAATTTRDVANHARGLASAVRRRFETDAAEDDVLEQRVRAELGRAVSHPAAIDVFVQDGTVTLSGPVLARDADSLLSAIGDVRGVTGIEDRLERHETAGTISALQGASDIPVSTFEFLQENWTPAARLLATVTGGAIAAAALRDARRSPIAALVAAAGVALALRGMANSSFSRMSGIGAGRHAVTVQKSINIAAPIDEVFAWMTEWERWPEWMSHVREVRATGERGSRGERTHWVVDGPPGLTVEWDAETTRIEQPTLVAWKTVDGSLVAHTGTVRLVPTDQGFTRVDVQMSYNPIAGGVGHAVAALLSRDPKRQLDDDLARLKIAIETLRAPHDAVRQMRADKTVEIGETDRGD